MCAVLDVAGDGGVSVHDLVPLTTAADLGPLPLAVALLLAVRVEDDRLPDLRRCERIRWVRWVIENAVEHAEIDIWQNTRKTEVNTLLWFREEYLVVLGQRQGYWLLRTAYCTEKSGRIAQLRQERDASRSANPKNG